MMKKETQALFQLFVIAVEDPYPTRF